MTHDPAIPTLLFIGGLVFLCWIIDALIDA